MKKILSILLLAVMAISFAACAPAKPADSREINVGVAFYPMKDILLLIQDDLKAEGYDLKIHEFTDYQTPNNLVKNEELDANMIQHDYFLQSFNEANDASLVTVQPIYHATFALYSKDFATVEEIPDKTAITLPDDATNLSRALYLLDQAGLITLKEGKVTGLTLEDIVSNPKDLKLDDQVPLTSLAQRYVETGMAIMYPTYAKSLELQGDEERLYVEMQDDVTSGYAISLAAREDNENSDKIKALVKHLTSDKVRRLLSDDYAWASTPAF